MRNSYISALYELAKNDNNILALVADNGAIVFDKYRKDFPGRFVNFGIAEANMVSVAAGLAACGKIPFAYTISNFITMRAFEQVRNDVCLQAMNVKLVGIGCGFVYSNLGPTHHATEDITLMRALPNMTVLSPADPLEAKYITYAAAKIKGPVYIRLSVGGTPKIYEKEYVFKLGEAVTIKKGSDLTIIATGGIIYEILKAIPVLEQAGISVRLLNMHTIKPIDEKAILLAAKQTQAIITVEEHTVSGGLGSAVAEVLAEHGAIGKIRFKRMGLDNTFSKGYGSYDEMKETNGLSSKHIISQVKGLWAKKNKQ